jgi:hypothetical protein
MMKRFVTPGIWRGYVLLVIAVVIDILGRLGTGVAYAAVVGLYAIGIWIVFHGVEWPHRHRGGSKALLGAARSRGSR